MVAYILCCCSWMIFNSYFERFIRQTMLMNTFKIESPIIATAFLYTVFLYFWLWSKFFSSSVLLQISLLWFSFICFGFISLLGWWSCERIHEFPSWEAWSVLLFDISVLVQPSVVFIVFVDIVSLSIVFSLELLYSLYLCANNDKCFVCLTVFLLFLISLYFLLWGKKFPPAIVLSGYYLVVKLPFLQCVF